MAFDTQPVDFNYFLQRKYAQLQQQADAQTSNANSGAIQAATAAITGASDARLNNTRSDLLPAESRSQIGLQGAQTDLTRNQASVVVPTAMSQIRNTDAQTGFIGTQDKALTRDALTPFSLGNPTGALGQTLGPGGYQGFRLGSPVAPTAVKPRQLAGESQIAYMDRTGWGL